MAEPGEHLPPDHDLPLPKRIRALIVVDRERADVFQHFSRLFARDEDVEVTFDRRHGERRRAMSPFAPERRGRDRRHPIPETNLGCRQYVIVRKRRRGHSPLQAPVFPTNGTHKR